MIILGAGLAGCIAAHLFPGARILEAGGPETVGAHRAVLRFRSDAIARLTGIPFRKVRVYKSVVAEGTHYCGGAVPMPILNAYSRKVSGRVAERSIFNLALSERWIAPEDFHAQLVKRLPVEFNQRIARVSPTALWSPGMTEGIDRTDEPVISTIPLPVLLSMIELGKEYVMARFERASIFVSQWRLPGWDVFQTNYYPLADFGGIYRATVTGGTLIVESMDDVSWDRMGEVCASFGIDYGACDPARHIDQSGNSTTQQYGKITPLPDALRRSILLNVTRSAAVFSLGRFATWRNLLLDDLPDDAEAIRGLIRMTEYEHSLARSR